MDYVQLLAQGDNKHNVLSDISRKIKLFSLQKKVPFIVLAQLNRAIDSRTDKRPMLSDLKESGSLEQDADGVLFLSRLRNIEKKSVTVADITRLYIAKNRHGSEGEIELLFRGNIQRFENPSIRKV